MYKYLLQHPDIYMTMKEPHFFGRDLTFKRYRRISCEKDYLRLFEGTEDVRRRGEASVWYLYSRTAADEIKQYSSSPKIIILLRNPVDMMYSLHGHNLLHGRENIRDFLTALEAEPQRRRGQNVPKGVDIIQELFYRYVSTYSPHVERYLSTFGRDAVHIILFDDFKNDILKTYRALLDFLKVDPRFVPDLEVHNPQKRARIEILNTPPYRAIQVAKAIMPASLRSQLRQTIQYFNQVEAQRSPLDADLRCQLQREFASEVDHLSKLIDRDLGIWLLKTVETKSHSCARHCNGA